MDQLEEKILQIVKTLQSVYNIVLTMLFIERKQDEIMFTFRGQIYMQVYTRKYLSRMAVDLLLFRVNKVVIF